MVFMAFSPANIQSCRLLNGLTNPAAVRSNAKSSRSIMDDAVGPLDRPAEDALQAAKQLKTSGFRHSAMLRVR
jgi:hypothetical protein